MHQMETDDGKGTSPRRDSDTESVGSDSRASSSDTKKPSKSVGFNIPEDQTTTSNSHGGRGSEFGCSNNMKSDNNNNNNNDGKDYVELTVGNGIHEDSFDVRSVKAAEDTEHEEPGAAHRLERTLEKRSSSGSSVLRSASSTIKRVSQGVKRLTSITKKPTMAPSQSDRNKSPTAYALKGLKFLGNTDGGKKGWEVVEKRFNVETASTNDLLHRSKFGKCIGMITAKNEKSKGATDFAEELFDALARREKISGEYVNKDQLKKFWEQISDQSFSSRLQTFFDMFDKDADGRITGDEVRQIIILSGSANKLSNIEIQAKEHADLIMEEFDRDKSGYITIDELEMIFLQAPVQTNIGGESQINLSQMLCQKLKPTQESKPRKCYQYDKYFLVDNWQRVWLLCLWLGVVLGLFVYKFVQYRNKAVYDVMGYCVCTAKGAAETLKFNMALILLPVCRNTITWLRKWTKLSGMVPFDDNLNFHKVIAVGIVTGVVLHAGAHLTCDFPRLLRASEDEYEPMKQFFGDDKPENYWWFIKGVEGWTGIVMVVLMAIAFTLATPWFRRGTIKLSKPLEGLTEPLKNLTGFNTFWYSHHLFVIVYALLVVHGIKLYLSHEWYKKTTWMYLAIPLVLYTCERLVRAFRSSLKPVEIDKAVVYPGNVLALQMSKPEGFKYKSGQYMFVKCPAVSPFEWHPFSITSAPGDDYLSVHIKPLGDWTKQLKAVFSKVCHPPTDGKSGLLRAEINQGGGEGSKPNFPRMLIDGPYGAPAQDYKKYEVVLLIGMGIGATPMISIVKDIINNTKSMEDKEAALEAGISSTAYTNNSNNKIKSGFKTKKAYFYWVAPEQGFFNWFKVVMNEVAKTDKNGVIELHNYLTSVYEEGDARSTVIAMLQSLNHAKKGVDIVTGTHVKSHFARPNWGEVYNRIAHEHQNSRVGVFYCGNPAPIKELRRIALDFSHKTSTKFDFHKENF